MLFRQLSRDVPTLVYLACAFWFAVPLFSLASLCLASVTVCARFLNGPEHGAAVAYVAMMWSWLHKCAVAEALHEAWGDKLAPLWAPFSVLATLQLSGLMVSTHTHICTHMHILTERLMLRFMQTLTYAHAHMMCLHERGDMAHKCNPCRNAHTQLSLSLKHSNTQKYTCTKTYTRTLTAWPRASPQAPLLPGLLPSPHPVPLDQPRPHPERLPGVHMGAPLPPQARGHRPGPRLNPKTHQHVCVSGPIPYPYPQLTATFPVGTGCDQCGDGGVCGGDCDGVFQGDGDDFLWDDVDQLVRVPSTHTPVYVYTLCIHIMYTHHHLSYSLTKPLSFPLSPSVSHTHILTLRSLADTSTYTSH